jgi:hypothetical protein
MTIVGQSSGTVPGTLTGPGSSATTQTATIKAAGGDLYIRGLTVTGGSPGIWATAGNILRLDHVSVNNNTAGGILLDGAGFDIKNTTISNNGPNIAGTVVFGGIGLQNTPTATTVPRALSFTTVTGNQTIGISCGTGTMLTPNPTSVLAASNITGDVGGSCGFTSCAGASATCGAQP